MKVLGSFGMAQGLAADIGMRTHKAAMGAGKRFELAPRRPTR